MTFSAAGLSLYFNKTTFAVERLSADSDPEALSYVTGRTFGLPYGNNFITESTFSEKSYSAEFLYFNEVVCTLVVQERQGSISFSYVFRNDGKELLDIKEGELGIYLPFMDSYDEASLSLRRRVHAHLRTQGCAYAYCERYSGASPSLGMVMTEGRSYSYALEAGLGKRARGETILRLPAMKLSPGDVYSCELRFFLCKDKEEFFRTAEGFGFLMATANELVTEEGGEIVFRSSRAKSLSVAGKEILFEGGVARITASGEGEHTYTIRGEEQELLGSYYVLPKDIPARRARFVIEHQYIGDGAFRGAFAALDRASDGIVIRRGVHSPLNLGGYRAAPLIFLLHEGAKGRLAEKYKPIAKQAIAFYDEAFYRGGEVMDDVRKRARFHKGYRHYPLFAAIKYEEYLYSGNLTALMTSAVILSELFKNSAPYTLTPVTLVVEALKKEGKNLLAEELVEALSLWAEKLLKEDLYQAFKGYDYSEDILCGALCALLDLRSLTGEERYLSKAKELLPTISAFSFPSLEYASDFVPETFMYDVGQDTVRDVSTHDKAMHFAVAYYKYYAMTGEEEYLALSRKIALSCLTLFDDRGGAHPAKAAVKLVNDKELPSYHEISFGEDVVLYLFDLLFGSK